MVADETALLLDALTERRALECVRQDAQAPGTCLDDPSPGTPIRAMTLAAGVAVPPTRLLADAVERLIQQAFSPDGSVRAKTRGSVLRLLAEAEPPRPTRSG